MTIATPTFSNIRGETWNQRLGPLLRWRFTRAFRSRSRDPLLHRLPAIVENDGRLLRRRTSHLTWVGHSTFLVRLGGLMIATDPVWSSRLFSWRRRTSPGVAFENTPSIDVVTVSHNHYDHLDLKTLERIHRRDAPLFIVPRGNAKILRRAGICRVVELNWLDHLEVGDVKITLVPAQHWSARSLLDINRCLWGGFVFESTGGTVYHAGDTAFEPVIFEQIARKFNSIDWALFPIGAYHPQWFLGTQHTTPEDAGRAFQILGARTFVGMHHGTFMLTDEPVGEPALRTHKWFERRGLEDRLWLLGIGETRTLETRGGSFWRSGSGACSADGPA